MAPVKLTVCCLFDDCETLLWSVPSVTERVPQFRLFAGQTVGKELDGVVR